MGNCNSVDPVDETTIESGVEIVQKSGRLLKLLSA